MAQITIKKLYKLCKEEIDKGNSDKIIAISDDNEGNGFHGMFYGFTDYDKKIFEDIVHDSNMENLIILG